MGYNLGYNIVDFVFKYRLRLLLRQKTPVQIRLGLFKSFIPCVNLPSLSPSKLSPYASRDAAFAASLFLPSFQYIARYVCRFAFRIKATQYPPKVVKRIWEGERQKDPQEMAGLLEQALPA